MSYCGNILLSFILYITLALGTTKSGTVCPESKKLYPGDCRLFYKCVALYGPTSTPASVWIPTRCTAGMVFHPTEKKCVPNYTSNCRNDWNYDTQTRHPNSGVVLNALEADTVPLSALNNPPMDGIDKQMIHLKQLINNYHNANNGLKQVEQLTGIHEEKPQPSGDGSFTEIPNGKEPLPIQLGEITHQLILSKPPIQINVNGYQSNAVKYDPLNFTTYPFTTYVPGNLRPITKSSINEYHVMTPPSQLQSPYTHRPNINLSIINKNKPKPTSNYNVELYNDGDTFELAEDVETIYWYDKVNKFEDEDYVDDANDKNANKNNCEIGTRFPSVIDCRKYHICGAYGKDNFYEFTCPTNMAFNRLKKVCDAKAYKQCNGANIKRG